jgi:flagellar biosynthesis protein FlhF
MKIKSYYAGTVEDAVAQARQELGVEAMLVNSRKALPEARHLGEYEVVFAVAPAAGSAPAPEGPAGGATPPGTDRLSREVADLRKQLEGMRRSLTRNVLPGPVGYAAETSDLYGALVASDLNEELARSLLEAAEERLGGPRTGGPRFGAAATARSLERALAEEIQARCLVEPMLGKGNGKPAIVALVGPPGAGKTTTLVKLAVNFGLTTRRPTLVLSADTYRVAAAEQLRSYASILGVAFQVTATAGALAQHLEENRGKDLILIDTPGVGFADVDSATDLARFLATRPDIDTHLVLSASMKPADLSRVVDAYEIFRPHRLLFTRFDETASFGPVLGEVIRTGKPLSFFSTGQRIPEDLENASREKLMQLVLGGQAGAALSAA